jgi:hypothetical protein
MIDEVEAVGLIRLPGFAADEAWYDPEEEEKNQCRYRKNVVFHREKGAPVPYLKRQQRRAGRSPAGIKRLPAVIVQSAVGCQAGIAD